MSSSITNQSDTGVVIEAPGLPIARITLPQARVEERALRGKRGRYLAPANTETLKRLTEIGEQPAAELVESVNQWVEAQRRISVVRGRLLAGRLPSLDDYLVEGYTLRRVQTVGALIALQAPRTALFMDMGTGKTLTSLVACARRFDTHGLRRVLVIAPATVAGGWRIDTKKLAMHNRIAFDHVAGAKRSRLSRYERAALIGADGGDMLSIVAISYGVASGDAAEILKHFKPDAVIVDESHYIKNESTKRARAVKQLCDSARNVTLLTGTPYTEQPMDVFAQYKALDWRVFGDNREHFIDKYCKRSKNYAAPQAGDKVTISKGAEDKLSNDIYRIGFRARKEDVLDLPTKNEPQQHTVALKPATLRAIGDLRRSGLATIERLREEGASALVIAQTAVVVGLRVQQLAGGFATDDDTKTVSLVDSAKLDALSELAESLRASGESVVVFARFRAEVAAIRERLDRVYGKKRVGRVEGSVAAKRRSELVEEFQTGDGPRGIVLQIDSGAAGITLTRAAHTIYYSVGFSAATYWQSLDRTHRIGQTRPTFYHHLVADGSDDGTVLGALAGKRDAADAVIESWRK